jgi:RND family efflux transporter MFP subunit
MKFGRQVLLTLGILAVAGGLWTVFAPGAASMRARLGLPEAAVEAAAPGAPGAAGRGPGGGASVVIGAAVTEGRANARVSAIGDARALRSVTVKPLSSGRLVSLDAAAGTEVKAGDVIARLDDDLEAIALERAELAVEDAEVTHERVQQLRSRGAATDVQEREARLALDSAKLEARNAGLELERRKVLAPIGGVLGLPPVEVGDQVDTGTAIAAIEDRSSLLVEFRVPERAVGALAVGDAVAATPLARPELSLEGRISALDNRLEAASRTLLVQASLPNADDRLRPGMAFAVEMRLPGDPFPEIDALAIQWGAEGAFVWVERAGRAARVPVRVVQRNAERALVAGDLAIGERVVSEGVQRLREGAQLRFVGDPPPTADGAAAPTARGAPAVEPVGFVPGAAAPARGQAG